MYFFCAICSHKTIPAETNFLYHSIIINASVLKGNDIILFNNRITSVKTPIKIAMLEGK